MHSPQPFRYPLFQRLSDVVVTLRGLWLLLLFNILALFAFLGAPQGTDVLLAITEDASTGYEISSLAWLLVALFFWSIASEFCTRFLIYLTDNSGRSLAPQRVDFRKKTQKLLAAFFLFFPSGVMILAFLKTWLINFNDFNVYRHTNINHIHLAFILILIALVSLMLILHFLYYRGGIQRIASFTPFFSWMVTSKKEQEWLGKLYGILNDVRVDIPKQYSSNAGIDLPREIPLPNGMVLPYGFRAYHSNPVEDKNLLIWMFRIPFSFYSCLRKQLLILSTIATVFILTFALLPPGGYMFFGAASLICLAFACWQIVFVVIALADKVQRKFPVRIVLVVLFLVSSFYNKDHPARVLSGTSPASPALKDHFNAWMDQLKQKDSTYRMGPDRDTIPVVFVAAEGGALRTGAFTSMILGKLSDSFPSFAPYIYCYSGVSGGALGSNFFNALTIDHPLPPHTDFYGDATEAFYKYDFLAAATGKLVFGEIINYFLPWHFPVFDRAIALEKAWEKGYSMSGKSMSSSFHHTVGARHPAVFINTTEAESGLQCVWSNVRLEGFTLQHQRDLHARTGIHLRYSTAINLSTRFPLVSPGATLFYNDRQFGKDSTQRKHFVDGGYFENTGAETLLEVMKQLKLKDKPVRPYVIQFNFADDDSTIQSTSIKRFSEIMEIIGAIYNTRSGRSDLSQAYLKQYVDSLNGQFISLKLPLSTRQFPMSWMLSKTAMNRLRYAIEDMIRLNTADTSFTADKAELRKLFVY